MCKLIAFISLFVITLTAGISSQNKDDKFVTILRQGVVKTEDGSFTYYYEGADGSKRQEIGIVTNPGTDKESLVMKGSWSYFDENGNEVIVEYIADEKGFQPQGTHISHAISQAAYDAARRLTLNESNHNRKNLMSSL